MEGATDVLVIAVPSAVALAVLSIAAYLIRTRRRD